MSCVFQIEENAELADQLSTGAKSLHEVMKAKKKAESEAEEMKSALEEAEGALELEEVPNNFQSLFDLFHFSIFANTLYFFVIVEPCSSSST